MTEPLLHVTDLNAVPATRPTYVAVGVFDGVHRGHQALLGRLAEQARADGARSAVLTFFPHPVTVIRGIVGRLYLCTLEERIRLLGALGVDLIITEPFDEQLRLTPAADFVDRLRARLDMRQIWGGSFSLGYNREGTADFLREQGAVKGFAVQEVADLLLYDDRRISSSRTRRSLAAGDVMDAAACLGRPYRVAGAVVAGDGRGRQIGFPTANLAVWEEQVLPARGVYATYAWVAGQRYPAATNVGVRPTVNGTDLTVEAHILDFAGDLYGQEVALDFVHHIRDERRFPSLEALVTQIGLDVATTRQLLLATPT